MTRDEGPTCQVDRRSWNAGPWDVEGDREEWKTKAGLPGLMVRSHMGAWCGYAAVDPGHPYYERTYDEVGRIFVHGGLTYSGGCQGAICHTPAPGADDEVWWFGFDCAHAGDIVPGYAHLFGYTPFGPLAATYRQAGWVRLHVEQLARQLADAKGRR